MILVKFLSFFKGRKNIKLMEGSKIVYHSKAHDLEILNIFVLRNIPVSR